MGNVTENTQTGILEDEDQDTIYLPGIGEPVMTSVSGSTGPVEVITMGGSQVYLADTGEPLMYDPNLLRFTDIYGNILDFTLNNYIAI